MALTVVTHPAKVLSKPARRIRASDGIDLVMLRDEMSAAMREYVGVGLAAPQVGKSIRFLLAEDVRTGDIHALVNPQIIKMSAECDVGPEGCLSFPGLVGDVVRAKEIKVRYEDIDFNEHVEEISGFFARVVQHEIDHLNGILLIDRAEDGLRDAVPDDEEDDGDVDSDDMYETVTDENAPAQQGEG